MARDLDPAAAFQDVERLAVERFGRRSSSRTLAAIALFALARSDDPVDGWQGEAALERALSEAVAFHVRDRRSSASEVRRRKSGARALIAFGVGAWPQLVARLRTEGATGSTLIERVLEGLSGCTVEQAAAARALTLSGRRGGRPRPGRRTMVLEAVKRLERRRRRGDIHADAELVAILQLLAGPQPKPEERDGQFSGVAVSR